MSEKAQYRTRQIQSWRIICALWKENMLQSAIYANTLKVRDFYRNHNGVPPA